MDINLLCTNLIYFRSHAELLVTAYYTLSLNRITLCKPLQMFFQSYRGNGFSNNIYFMHKVMYESICITI